MAEKERLKKLACPYFAMNACKFGKDCFRSHDRSAKFDDVCRYYQMGTCSFGKKCRYRHVKLDKEPPKEDDDTLNLPEAKPLSQIIRLDPSLKNKAPIASNVILPLCPYMAKRGTCPDASCQFVHGDQCEYCQKFCLHPQDPKQRSQHHRACVDEHEKAMNEAFALQVSHDKVCGICLEMVLILSYLISSRVAVTLLINFLSIITDKYRHFNDSAFTSLYRNCSWTYFVLC
ncbi:hypothetical protein ACOME3_002459 [Neoechinorhynchus agilis]